MKGRINELARQLSMLEHPVNIAEAGKLFQTHQELFQAKFEIDSETRVQWRIIQKIYDAYLKLVALKTALSDEQLLPLRIKELNDIKLSAESKMDDLKKAHHRVQEKIATLYPELSNAYDSYRGRSQMTVTAEDQLIRQFMLLLKEEYQQLLGQNYQVLMGEKLNQQNESTQKLKELDMLITPSTDMKHIMHLSGISLKESRRLNSILHSLLSHRSLLSNIISKNSISAEISNLTKMIKEAKQQIVNLSESILSCELENVDELNTLYSMIADKESLLQERRKKIDQLNSYWPGALFSYFTNPNHQEELNREIEELEYLESLNEKFKLDCQLIELNKMIDATRTLLVSDAQKWPETGHADISSDEINMIINSIRDFIPRYKAREPVSSVSLLVDLTDIIPLVQKAHQKYAQTHQLLTQFADAKKAMQDLERHPGFTPQPQPSPEEFSVLKKESEQRQNRLGTLAGLISKCQNLLSLYAQQNQIHNQLLDSASLQSKTLNQLLQLETQLLRLKKRPVDTKKMDEYSAKIIIELKLLQTTLKPVNEHRDTSKETLDEAIAEARIRRADTMDSHITRLQYWNSMIIQKLGQLSIDLNEWYVELYMCLQSQRVNEATKLQMYQLLKDILFELNEPQAQMPHATLYHYKLLCPNPQQQWRNLLAFKPAVNPDLEETGKLHAFLNRQIESLTNRKYLREARLLADLAHQLQKQTEGISTANIKACLSDPRYKSLYEHRGFWILSQWAAQASTAVWNFFSKTPSSFEQSIFYKRTATVHCIQEDFESAFLAKV
ncbi:interaptin [Legionella birminghamensis]|uniref:Effector protein A, substrate of the Dot/Icm secretion system n=1 Tax=Legionella birminghamensis TaxID=28083 RepID=A0A378IE87_9GAMM|nr:hypothetical protein [Legionella birminghamensis]KTC72442.1 interaptin [Legionella birminghamensis]STX30574.1 effector protein A, substrate of the Dot/Icm secretion system [Legionella birminghamensis]